MQLEENRDFIGSSQKKIARSLPHQVQAVREKSHLFRTEVVADENASREAGDRIQPTTQVVGRKWKNDEQPRRGERKRGTLLGRVA